MKNNFASRILRIVSALVLTVAGFANAAAQGQPLFAFAVNNASTFWMQGLAGTLQAEKDFGVKVEFYMTPNASIEGQKSFIESMVAKGAKGFGLSIIDPEGSTPFLNEIAKKVPIILTDSDAPKSDRVAYVGPSNYKAGRICGQKIREQIPSGGKIAIFVGRMDSQNAIERRQGIIDELSGKPMVDYYPGTMTPNKQNIKIGKWTIIDTKTDNADESRAKANVEDVLIKNKDVALLTGLWSYNTPAIISAMKDANKLGKIKIVGFDDDDVTLQAVKDGYVAGSIVQDPYQFGYKCIELLYKLNAKKDAGIPANKMVDVPVKWVTKDGVDQLMKVTKEHLDAANAAKQ
jgi:ribose transport system substrate-binding protein